MRCVRNRSTEPLGYFAMVGVFCTDRNRFSPPCTCKSCSRLRDRPVTRAHTHSQLSECRHQVGAILRSAAHHVRAERVLGCSRGAPYSPALQPALLCRTALSSDNIYQDAAPRRHQGVTIACTSAYHLCSVALSGECCILTLAPLECFMCVIRVCARSWRDPHTVTMRRSTSCGIAIL